MSCFYTRLSLWLALLCSLFFVIILESIVMWLSHPPGCVRVVCRCLSGAPSNNSHSRVRVLCCVDRTAVMPSSPSHPFCDPHYDEIHSELIETHNTANDGSTFTLGHNAFSHLSWEEFKKTVRHFVTPCYCKIRRYIIYPHIVEECA